MVLTVAYALWGVNEQEMGWEEELKKKGEDPEGIFHTDPRLCCMQGFEK